MDPHDGSHDLLLGQQMSVSATARHLGESDKPLWRVLEHYVMEAHGGQRLEPGASDHD